MKKHNKKSVTSILFVLCISVCTVLLMTTVSTPAKAASLPFAVEIPRDSFPVRSTANDQSAIAITLSKGSLLYPEGKVGSWYQVPLLDKIGFVHEDYVTAVQGRGTVSLSPGAALRNNMDKTAKVLSLCSKNTEVSISSTDGAWCRVTPYASGQSGYLSVDALSFPDKTLYRTSSGTNKTYIVAADQTKVYSEAGANGSVYATLRKGEEVTYLSAVMGNEGKQWYKVFTKGGKVGYLLGDNLEGTDGNNALIGKIIVIDPGHGSLQADNSPSLDLGAIGYTGLQEKDVNLKIAVKLKSYLESAGATVLLTRSADVGVLTLTQRAAFANKNKADIFVSVHCNTSSNASTHGSETYYCYGNSENIVSTDIVAKRKVLAASVQKYLVEQGGTVDRGVKTANYQVLLKTTMPSILVQTAFISNSSDEALLKTEEFQDKAAKGIFLGIVDYAIK